MTRLSHLISGVLISLIVLTAQSAAAARTMPDATGQMVICTGTGPMMIYVDAKGESTGAPQICPEYALSLIVALAFEESASEALGAWQMVDADLSVLEQRALRLGTPNARAPPVLV